MEVIQKEDQGSPVALLDWDNCLHRGITLLPWAEALRDAGLFPQRLAVAIADLIAGYQASEVPYEEMAARAPVLYAEGLAGVRVEDVYRCASEFVKADKERLWPGTSILLEGMREAGIATVVISGAPGEILENYSLHLSIDCYRGLGLESARDTYTGALLVNTAIGATKAALAPRYGAPVVLAAGDSDADRPMLELAAAQIVFDNPDLFRGAATALHVESARYDPRALKAFVARVLSQGQGDVSGGHES